METKKKALGKGLEQLFANNVIDFDNFEKEIVTENKNDKSKNNLSLILAILASIGILGGIIGFIIKKLKGHREK